MIKQNNIKIEKPLGIHFLSMVTTPIEMYFNDTYISSGTGFFYSYEEKVYLVTNYHNITGINPLTGKNLSLKGLKPNKIKIFFHTQHPERNKGTFHTSDFLEQIVDLYYEDFISQKWWHYPGYNNGEIDVVVIPNIITTSIKDKILFNCINKYSSFKNERPSYIGDDVFIIGYPWNLKGGSKVLPIWKKGSIATEPNVCVDNFCKESIQKNSNTKVCSNLPIILIDAKTTNSMSGSPVVSNFNGLFDKKLGSFPNFLGIYSGRMNQINKNSKKNEVEKLFPSTTEDLERFILDINRKSNITTELGIVWKKEVIERIIRSNYCCSKEYKDIMLSRIKK